MQEKKFALRLFISLCFLRTDEMPGLSALYLNDNLLSELQAETIPFTRSSTAVRLDHNHISTIEQDAFYVMGEAGQFRI